MTKVRARCQNTRPLPSRVGILRRRLRHTLKGISFSWTVRVQVHTLEPYVGRQSARVDVQFTRGHADTRRPITNVHRILYSHRLFPLLRLRGWYALTKKRCTSRV